MTGYWALVYPLFGFALGWILGFQLLSVKRVVDSA